MRVPILIWTLWITMTYALSGKYHCELSATVIRPLCDDLDYEELCKAVKAPDLNGGFVETQWGRDWITFANEPCCCESGPAHAMSAGACQGRYSNGALGRNKEPIRLQWCNFRNKDLPTCTGEPEKDWEEFVGTCISELSKIFVIESACKALSQKPVLKRLGECLHAIQDFPNHTNRYPRGNAPPLTWIHINQHHRDYTRNDNDPTEDIKARAQCLSQRFISKIQRKIANPLLCSSEPWETFSSQSSSSD